MHREPTRESVAGILTLIELATGGMASLSRLCREVAAITGVDVVSAYVLEEATSSAEPARLVMRGNVGFPEDAIGRVTLALGEGLAGNVARCMVSASVAVGYDDEQFVEIPGLPERDFPAFLAVPIFGRGGVRGVLVLQSREPRAFRDADIALATALAAPFSFAVDQRAPRPSANTPLVLSGSGSGGTAIGRAALMPALADRRTHDGDASAAAGALDNVTRELGRRLRRLAADTPHARDLEPVLADSRFRTTLLAECEEHGIPAAAYRIALRYAKAAYGSTPSPWLVERAAELETLCSLVRACALDETLFRRGSAIVTPRLTGLLVVAAASRGATAIVSEGPVAPDSPALGLARAARLPVVWSVRGACAAIVRGDPVIVDGESGVVRVRPSASDVARARATRRPSPKRKKPGLGRAS